MVIKQVKHWIKHRANASAWKAMQDWAEQRGAHFEQMEECEGFEIEEREQPGGPPLDRVGAVATQLHRGC